MKPKLAFVDHSFHAKTRSGDFLRTLFSAVYDVVDFWDESWHNGPAVTAEQVNASGAEVVFFFQSLMSFSELRRLTGRIVWAPMYDSVPLQNHAFWLELGTLPIKMLTFSSTLHQHFLTYHLDSLYVQYFFNPATLPHVTDYSNLRIFFWQRTDITFTQVKQLLGEAAVTRCVIKLNPDPRYSATKPTPADIDRYHIELVEAGFTDKEQYLALLQSCNVFICPRRYEGIGMSFLEAMAMGLIPVALNHPTMNEYIQDRVTGWLWDQPTPMDFKNIAAMSQAVQNYVQAGYDRWQKQHETILAFMQQPATVTRVNRWFDPVRFRWFYGIYLAKQVWQRLTHSN